MSKSEHFDPAVYKCRKCSKTTADWHEPDANGVRFTVKLLPSGKRWICTKCKET